MASSVLSHFKIAWKAYKANWKLFVSSMFGFFVAWVMLEVAVISFQRLGLVIWLVLHLAFFFLISGLMVGFCRLSLTTVEGRAPQLSDLTGSFHRGPTFLLAACTGKSVLDVGCIGQDRDFSSPDWLHNKIRKVAARIDGVDILVDAVAQLRKSG